MVQWLGLHASTAGGMGLIPGRATEILQAAWQSQKKKKEERKEKDWSREVSKLEGTTGNSGASTTDLQMRNLGRREGWRQQQDWKAGFPTPSVFIPEGAEGELQLLGCG